MFPVGNIPLTFASPSLSSLPDPLLIELGRCNEHIPPHLLKAGHLNDFSRKRWQCGKLSKGPNKTQYTYTFEGHNATPSPMFAKRVGDKFYISQYRSFAVSCQEFLRRPSDDPDAAGWFEDEEPPSHYFAVLEKVQEGEFQLLLTCLNASLGILDTPAKCIATIKHGTYKIPEARADVRVVKVTVPGLTKMMKKESNEEDDEAEDEPDEPICAGFGDDCWAQYCSEPGEAAARFKQNLKVISATGKKPLPAKIAEVKSRIPFANLGSEGTLQFANKVPIWNPEINSLVLKFDRNRVQRASAKNFVMFKGNDLQNPKETSEAVLQFGKTQRGTYSCDYRFPLSALQAFGVALTTFAWEGGGVL